MVVSLFLIKTLGREESHSGVELKEVTSDVSAMSEPTTVSFVCSAEKSAFEVLLDNAAVTAEEYDSERMVTSVNGKESGGGRFWIFAVNGQESTVSAELYRCRGEEMVSWTLR